VTTYDYIVGSVARGMRVVPLLEAGADGARGHDRETYAVPAFHGLATEDPEVSWQAFAATTPISISRNATRSTSPRSTESSIRGSRPWATAPPAT